MQNRAGWLRFLERLMTDVRNDRAADHNRYFDHPRGPATLCSSTGPAVSTAPIAGSKAMVILDGSHSVKVIHPASPADP